MAIITAGGKEAVVCSLPFILSLEDFWRDLAHAHTNTNTSTNTNSNTTSNAAAKAKAKAQINGLIRAYFVCFWRCVGNMLNTRQLSEYVDSLATEWTDTGILPSNVVISNSSHGYGGGGSGGGGGGGGGGGAFVEMTPCLSQGATAAVAAGGGGGGKIVSNRVDRDLLLKSMTGGWRSGGMCERGGGRPLRDLFLEPYEPAIDLKAKAAAMQMEMEEALASGIDEEEHHHVHHQDEDAAAASSTWISTFNRAEKMFSAKLARSPPPAASASSSSSSSFLSSDALHKHKLDALLLELQDLDLAPLERN